MMQKIDELVDIKKEIMSMRLTAPMMLFVLDCAELNHDLAQKAQKLRDTLVKNQMDENRELNKA